MTSATDRRVALVANTGFYIGPPVARELARRGHDLVVGDPEEGLVEELETLGAAVEPVQGMYDLADAEIAERLVSTALARFGRIDAATAFTGEIIGGRFLQSTIDDLHALQRGTGRTRPRDWRGPSPTFRWGGWARWRNVLRCVAPTSTARAVS